MCVCVSGKSDRQDWSDLENTLENFELIYINWKLENHFKLWLFTCLIGRPIHSALCHIEVKSFVNYYDCSLASILFIYLFF